MQDIEESFLGLVKAIGSLAVTRESFLAVKAKRLGKEANPSQDKTFLNKQMSSLRGSIRTWVSLDRWSARMLEGVLKMDRKVALGEKVYQAMIKMAKTERILPVVGGGYATASEVILPGKNGERGAIDPWKVVETLSSRVLQDFYKKDLQILDYETVKKLQMEEEAREKAWAKREEKRKKEEERRKKAEEEWARKWPEVDEETKYTELAEEKESWLKPVQTKYILQEDEVTEYLITHGFLMGVRGGEITLEQVRPKSTYIISGMVQVIDQIKTVKQGREMIAQLMKLRATQWMGRMEYLPMWPDKTVRLTREVPADYLIRLGMSKWVIGEGGKMSRPDEVKVGDFARYYRLWDLGEFERLRKLLHLLGFKEEVEKW